VAGRPFSDRENVKNGPPVMVVNEALVKAYWPGQSALGRCAVVGTENKACAEIVGVVADSTMWASFAFIHDATPQYFVPIEQYATLSPQRAVMVRTNGSPDDLLTLLRTQAQTAGASLPFIDVWSFDDVFQPALKPLRLGAQIFGVLGLLGLAIACAGLAAVTAYGVTRRTRELGIRMALGASPADLTRRTVVRTLVAVIIGLAVGGLAAYGSGRWVKDLLFEVDPTDWRPYVLVAITLTALAAVAAYLPARRAGRVDPMIALRSE
jgi:ABC-type antimicrobial peptide transport system permease subunit